MGASQSAAAHVSLDRGALLPSEPLSGAVLFHTTKPVPYYSVTLQVRLQFSSPTRVHTDQAAADHVAGPPIVPTCGRGPSTRCGRGSKPPMPPLLQLTMSMLALRLDTLSSPAAFAFFLCPSRLWARSAPTGKCTATRAPPTTMAKSLSSRCVPSASFGGSSHAQARVSAACSSLCCLFSLFPGFEDVL
jgi:hypothetical protein